MHTAGAALALLAFSLLMAWQAFALRLGVLSNPGPGFFPFWIAMGLMGTSLVLLVEARRGHRGSVPRMSFAGFGRVLLVSASIAAYGALLEYIGFVLTTLGFLVFLSAGIDRQPPLRSTLLAALSVAGAYLLFDALLRVQFPRGPLGF